MRYTPPPSLRRGVSPPRIGSRGIKRKRIEDLESSEHATTNIRRTDSAFPTPAAIEAGKAEVRDYLSYFAGQLSRFSRNEAYKEDGASEKSLNTATTPQQAATLSIDIYRDLYTRSADSRAGHHFVIHQHDHPRAGTHYDLRLQINEDSSCSWAIPYGLPGNPSERRHGRRQGIETRVHSLWNHLIEAASHKTGSMLIWDTGEYEVIPYEDPKVQLTDDELSAASTDDEGHRRHDASQPTESEKLSAAFRSGKIRLRLHGTRLPAGYTISIRLSSDSTKAKITGRNAPNQHVTRRKQKRKPNAVKTPQATDDKDDDIEEAPAQDRQDVDSDAGDDPAQAAIRANNAYPGARNTVGSIHQRWWFVSMDKQACGFVKGKNEDGHVVWSPRDAKARDDYPFFVRGRDVERSVVTGRKAADVLGDDGVENYIFRGGWKPILF